MLQKIPNLSKYDQTGSKSDYIHHICRGLEIFLIFSSHQLKLKYDSPHFPQLESLICNDGVERKSGQLCIQAPLRPASHQLTDLTSSLAVYFRTKAITLCKGVLKLTTTITSKYQILRHVLSYKICAKKN